MLLAQSPKSVSMRRTINNNIHSLFGYLDPCIYLIVFTKPFNHSNPEFRSKLLHKGKSGSQPIYSIKCMPLLMCLFIYLYLYFVAVVTTLSWFPNASTEHHNMYPVHI